MRDTLEQLLSATLPLEWEDDAGASLIKTMGKAWGDSIPRNVAYILMVLARRQLPVRRLPPAARDSAALAIANLLPALLRYEGSGLNGRHN